jgi:PPOX class probable F420-dependent enzyme
MPTPIPEAFQYLLNDPITVSLATVMSSGQPHVNPVWVDFDGEYIYINTARGRQKDRDMSAPGARVSLLAVDPKNINRYLEVRGRVVESTEEGGVDHINKLSMKYRGEPDYFARIPHMRDKMVRVIYKIEPKRVSTREG